MTKISAKPFTCLKCGSKGEFKMYDTVNVTLDPNLRERVLSGEIFDWTCPQCGETLNIRHNLLYHDMKKKFQVYYSPLNCVELNDIMNETLAKWHGMIKTVRTVDSLNALSEKIFVFEEGLNDIAIELSKVFIKISEEKKISKKNELRFEKLIVPDKDTSKGKLIFRQIIDKKPQKGLILFEKETYDKFVKEVTTNEKFKMNNYCDTIDEKWILNRI